MIRSLLEWLFGRDEARIETACILNLGVDQYDCLMDRLSPNLALRLSREIFNLSQVAARKLGGAVALLEPENLLIIVPNATNLETRYQTFLLAGHCVAGVRKLLREFGAQGGQAVHVGVHTGKIVFAPRNMPFIGMGDAINLAGCLLDIARTLGLEILASQEAITGLAGRLQCIEHQVTSKNAPLSVCYQIIRNSESSGLPAAVPEGRFSFPRWCLHFGAVRVQAYVMWTTIPHLNALRERIPAERLLQLIAPLQEKIRWGILSCGGRIAQFDIDTFLAIIPISKDAHQLDSICQAMLSCAEEGTSILGPYLPKNRQSGLCVGITKGLIVPANIAGRFVALGQATNIAQLLVGFGAQKDINVTLDPNVVENGSLSDRFEIRRHQLQNMPLCKVTGTEVVEILRNQKERVDRARELKEPPKGQNEPPSDALF